MTRYFTALLVYMVVFSLAGNLLDGFDSKQGAAMTVLLSTAAACVVYLLYPIFNQHDE